MDNIGEGRDLGCKEPTNGMLPLSTNRREVFGLRDMISCSKCPIPNNDCRKKRKEKKSIESKNHRDFTPHKFNLTDAVIH